MTEVATLKFTGMGDETQDTEVDIFLKRLSKVVDDEGKVCYPVLVRLGYALATIYNSSSSAERDFSLMNAFLADKSKNKSSLKLLLTKMHIKAECLSLARSCAKCKVLKVQGKEGTHWHCVQWKPSEELLATLRDGGPWKRYKAEMEERSQEQKDKEVMKVLLREEDRPKKQKDMKKELALLKERSRIAIREGKKKVAQEKKRKENEEGAK
jgi:hypothetical protein